MSIRALDTYFRVGIGMVIYRPDGHVCVFQRTNPNSLVRPWQFPQGGLEVGESTEDALWREAQEEIGLVQGQVLQVTPVPDPISYQYEGGTSGRDNLIGRCNYWYFLKVADNFEINLNNALEKEFTRHEWVTIKEAALRAEDTFHKRGYSQLATYFKDII